MNETCFSVELEKDLSHTGDGVDGSRTEALDEERFTLIDDDRHFFTHDGLGEEVASRESTGRRSREIRQSRAIREKRDSETYERSPNLRVNSLNSSNTLGYMA